MRGMPSLPTETKSMHSTYSTQHNKYSKQPPGASYANKAALRQRLLLAVLLGVLITVLAAAVNLSSSRPQFEHKPASARPAAQKHGKDAAAGHLLRQTRPDSKQPHKTAAASEATSTDNCPSWLADYAAFHKQQRGQPNAKYLVYTACPGRSGLGDRIRGMMYLTRQAVALNRVILFTWRGAPHEAERYLPPAGLIDWTLNGIQGYELPATSTYCDKAVTPPPDTNCSISSSSSTSGVVFKATDYKDADLPARVFIRRGGLAQLSRHRFVTVHTNQRLDTACSGCPDVAEPMPSRLQLHNSSAAAAAGAAAGGAGDGLSLDTAPPIHQVNATAACLYQYLFGLSDDVQSAVQEQLSKLYGPQAEEPGFQFLAIHMRLGGMENEKSFRSSKGGRNGPLLDLMDGLACIQKLGTRVGVNIQEVPVLLFTDHSKLRDFVAAGRLANVITSDITPTHLARMTEKEAADPAAAMSTYVDVALLARARCAIYADSGFSATAWMMGGGTDCYARFSEGLEQCIGSQQAAE